MKKIIPLSLIIIITIIVIVLTFQSTAWVELSKSNDLMSKNDDFTEIGLHDKWHVFDPYNSLDLKFSNDALEFYASRGGWYFSNIGPFVYQEVDGNFLVTSRLQVKGIKTNSPKFFWSLAGIMVRQPNPDQMKENWIYTMLGTDMNHKYVIDQKNTVLDRSDFTVYLVEDTWVTLAMIRIGDYLLSAYKLDNEDWNLLKKYKREDFQDKLEVGISNISDWEVQNESDVVGVFDWIKFYRIDVIEDLNEKVVNHESEVDQYILEILKGLD